MDKELGRLPEHHNETDKYGTELATRLAEHAHDMNQERITYEVIVQGAVACRGYKGIALTK